MRTDAEKFNTFREVQANPNNTFVYGNTPEMYSHMKDILSVLVPAYTQVNFDEFLQGGFEVPRLPQLNDIVQRCFTREQSKGRTAGAKDQKYRATIIVHGMFDPSVFGGNTENYFRLFREMISDEKYNPGIRFILMEDPLLSPKLSDIKGTDNPLYRTVTYVNMETGQSSRLLQ